MFVNVCNHMPHKLPIFVGDEICIFVSSKHICPHDDTLTTRNLTRRHTFMFLKYRIACMLVVCYLGVSTNRCHQRETDNALPEQGSSSRSGTPCAFTSLICLPRWSLIRSAFCVPLLRTYTTCWWTSSMYCAFVLKNWAFLSKDFTVIDPRP